MLLRKRCQYILIQCSQRFEKSVRLVIPAAVIKQIATLDNMPIVRHRRKPTQTILCAKEIEIAPFVRKRVLTGTGIEQAGEEQIQRLSECKLHREVGGNIPKPVIYFFVNAARIWIAGVDVIAESKINETDIKLLVFQNDIGWR